MRAIVYEPADSSNGETLYYAEYYGTSSESKPTTGVVTGSLFIEVDTGDGYLFNESTSAWVKQ